MIDQAVSMGVLEIVLVLAGLAILLLLGVIDRALREVPTAVVVLLFGISLLIFSTKILSVSAVDRILYLISVLGTLLIVAIMGLVALRTNAVGLGDIIVVLASGMLVPVIPLGVYTKAFSMIPWYSSLLALLLIYLNNLRSTIYRRDFPPRFRRVVPLTAGNIKSSVVITYYPVYVEGMGFVYDEIFSSGDPRENTLRILSRVSDHTMVFAVPNYPFIFYYAISYIIVSTVFTLLGLIEETVFLG